MPSMVVCWTTRKRKVVKMEFKVDDEFRSLIPPLTDDESQRLEKSILAEGVREPIITWNGLIVDGHNRYRICQKHGIDCPNREHEFASRDAAKIWIIENQFGRRNLSKYDRGVLALQLESMYAIEAKRRQAQAGGNHGNQYTGGKMAVSQKSDEAPIRTDEQIAKLAGMSRDTIRKVKVIENEANAGNETAINAREEVKSGTESIHGAFTKIRHNGNESDTRNICSICGKPIDSGDCYPHDVFKHKTCANLLENQNKKASGNKYYDAERSLRENVAVYNVDSLIMELTSSANNLRESWKSSVETNEIMGVKLSKANKNKLEKAANNLLETLERIERTIKDV
jgi:hypothetical protein